MSDEEKRSAIVNTKELVPGVKECELSLVGMFVSQKEQFLGHLCPTMLQSWECKDFTWSKV